MPWENKGSGGGGPWGGGPSGGGDGGGPPAPLPRLHELAGPDTAPRRLGAGFLVNIVERVAAIRILDAEVAGSGVTDLWCRNWISSCK